MENYWKKSGFVTKYFNISSTTLMNWAQTGKIERKQFIEGAKYLYNMEPWLKETRKHVIYTRVSNSKQKMDLETQISVLRQYVVANGNQVDEVFSDIASGMNENRTSFMKLIKLVTSNQVDVVYISYKDRLTRFGFGYFEQLFELFGTEIKVLNSTTESEFHRNSLKL